MHRSVNCTTATSLQLLSETAHIKHCIAMCLNFNTHPNSCTAAYYRCHLNQAVPLLDPVLLSGKKKTIFTGSYQNDRHYMTLTCTTHAYNDNTNIKLQLYSDNGSKKGVITRTKSTIINLHIYRCIPKQFHQPWKLGAFLNNSTSHESYVEVHCTYCWPFLWINYFHHGNQHVNPTILLLQLTKMRYTLITVKTSDCTQECTRNNRLAYFTQSIQHKGTHES